MEYLLTLLAVVAYFVVINVVNPSKYPGERHEDEE